MKYNLRGSLAFLHARLGSQRIASQLPCSESSFLEYVKRSGLPFHPHSDFKKKDLDERQQLYAKICAEIWDPGRFKKELEK